MRKSVSLTLAAAMLVASVSIASAAATVEPTAGNVSLNSGNGYKNLSGATGAPQGSKVSTGPTGEANIIYENGCVEHVDPDKLVSVRTGELCLQSPLKPSAAINPVGFVVPVAVIAVGACVAFCDDGDKPKAAAPASIQ